MSIESAPFARGLTWPPQTEHLYGTGPSSFFDQECLGVFVVVVTAAPYLLWVFRLQVVHVDAAPAKKAAGMYSSMPLP